MHYKAKNFIDYNLNHKTLSIKLNEKINGNTKNGCESHNYFRRTVILVNVE